MSLVTQTATLHDCRGAFADTLIALAHEDERIVAVCNDSVGSSNLTKFKAEFPDRMINVGIAEQDLVGVAAGLANGGLIPFASAAAPFLTGRALEQVKADVAYSQARVVLCGQSPGLAYGELGPTHHSIEDLSWLRAVADLPIVVPADPVQTAQAVRWAAANPGPSYLRIPRFPVPDVTPPGSPFQPGRALQLTDGNDVTVIATGTMVSRALQAARSLAIEGIAGTCPQCRIRGAARHRGRPGGSRPDQGDRHRRGGNHHRRPRSSGGGADRAAAADTPAHSRGATLVRAHREHGIPPGALRPDR